jgi:hypothetical protein
MRHHHLQKVVGAKLSQPMLVDHLVLCLPCLAAGSGRLAGRVLLTNWHWT